MWMYALDTIPYVKSMHNLPTHKFSSVKNRMIYVGVFCLQYKIDNFTLVICCCF